VPTPSGVLGGGVFPTQGSNAVTGADRRRSVTLDVGPERAACSLPACCPGNLAPRKVPPGEDLARADRLGQVRDLPGKLPRGPTDLRSGFMDRSAIPAPKRCSYFSPGHTVHWIQALHVANKPEVEARTRCGVIQSISGDVVEVHFDDGDVVRYRNHETGRLSIVTSGSGPVSVNDQYSLLRAGGSCFSVARDAGRPLQPCATDDVAGTDPAALAEGLHTHGGFSTPLHDG
jgi:hypothetical protein